MFPLNRIADIQQNPSEFKLLEMLPAKHWTLPITLNQPNDGEVMIARLEIGVEERPAKHGGVEERRLLTNPLTNPS